MLRLVLFRGVLIALPFVAWFGWRWWANRTGRAMGSTPWAWLFAAGGLLVGVSLLLTPLFHTAHRDEVYIPGEVMTGGRVTEGHFEKP